MWMMILWILQLKGRNYCLISMIPAQIFGIYSMQMITNLFSPRQQWRIALVPKRKMYKGEYL